MKKSYILLLIFTAALFEACAFQKSILSTLKSELGGWSLKIDNNGAISELDVVFNDELVSVPWRTDSINGPFWVGVKMTRVSGDKLLFEGQNNDQVYSIEYQDVGGKLTMVAQLKNDSSKYFFADSSVSLRLGIDNEMTDPKTYYEKFFPTLLRCEKTHFWGYFQNPNGQILTISSPDAIASRDINYMGMGHRIATSTLNMLHTLPLPKRHPQQLIKLMPGEKRTWHIIIQPASSLDEVLPIVAINSMAPAIGLDRTTVASGETIELTVHFDGSENPNVTLHDPNGKSVKLANPLKSKSKMIFNIPAPSIIGNYIVRAKNGHGKQTEAIFHVRKPWGWYLNQARSEALRMQIKPMMHREGWLGFFSAFLANTYFPDKEKLAEIEAVFDNFYAIMVDSTKTDFYNDKPTWHSRPQNTSWMVGLMVARYGATKKIEDLEEAAKWGDHFIEKFQLPNGAFEGYTALTLGGKFLSELAWYERPFAENSTIWKDRYERHMLAIDKAAKNILEVKDMGDTEGESTYEDTQAGSAWSLLALHALNTKDETLRKEFLEASLEMQKRHECLTQALIPDGRMRGGTLRFWESQYDILTLPNMMNSPHGWTMRSQFGAFYLYLLTGEERFLNIMNNAMGACTQAIDEQTGVLRWAFVPDPYINALMFVPDPENPEQGKRVSEIIGEQWMPMVSDWWRVPKGEIGSLDWKRNGYHGTSQGWSCDNDVHEHFRVMAEQFVPNAFVLERADGSLQTMNCQVERVGNTLKVQVSEDIVCRVHFNLKNGYKVKVNFTSEKIEKNINKGMDWVIKKSNIIEVPDLYVER